MIVSTIIFLIIGVLNELLRDFLPGAVTVITERSQALNTDLNPKSNTVGVRVPDHDFIRFQFSNNCDGKITR